MLMIINWLNKTVNNDITWDKRIDDLGAKGFLVHQFIVRHFIVIYHLVFLMNNS